MNNKNLKEWARHEVNEALSSISFDNEEHQTTISSCYETAYILYSLLIDECERMKVENQEFVNDVLIRLLDGDNLSPITDNNDDWILIIEGGFDREGRKNSHYMLYQNKRLDTLYKKVTWNTENEAVTEYRHIDRAISVNINTRQIYTGGFGPVLLDQMYPITFPYDPSLKVKIYTESFKYQEDYEGDFDTLGVLYFQFDGKEPIEVKRFFKVDVSNTDPENNGMIEIEKAEYFARKQINAEREISKEYLKEDVEING